MSIFEEAKLNGKWITLPIWEDKSAIRFNGTKWDNRTSSGEILTDCYLRDGWGEDDWIYSEYQDEVADKRAGNIVDAYHALKAGKVVTTTSCGLPLHINCKGEMCFSDGSIALMYYSAAKDDWCTIEDKPKRYRVKSLEQLFKDCGSTSSYKGLRYEGQRTFVSDMWPTCGELLPEGFKPGERHEGFAYDEWMLEEVEV